MLQLRVLPPFLPSFTATLGDRTVLLTPGPRSLPSIAKHFTCHTEFGDRQPAPSQSHFSLPSHPGLQQTGRGLDESSKPGANPEREGARRLIPAASPLFGGPLIWARAQSLSRSLSLGNSPSFPWLAKMQVGSKRERESGLPRGRQRNLPNQRYLFSCQFFSLSTRPFF